MRVHVILATLIVALSGCALLEGRDDDDRLTELAETLEERTDSFYNELRRGTASGETLQDAGALAQAADRFERAAAAGDSQDELRDEWDVLSQRYHDLRRKYDAADAHSMESERFDEITAAYLELEGRLHY